MNRRRFLETTVAGACVLGGCVDALGSDPFADSTPTAVPSEISIGDWLMRGRDPAHRAVTGDVPTLTGNRQWELPLPTQPGTAPVVAGELVMIGVGDTLMAASAIDGTHYWSTAFDATITGQPIVHANRLYVGTAGPGLFALNTRTGERLWQFDFPGNVPSTAVHTPAVVEGGIIATLDAEAGLPTVFSVDPDTSDPHWETTPLDRPADPVPVNETLYTTGVVQSLRDGQVLGRWSSPSDLGVTPAVSDGHVVALEASGDAPSRLVALSDADWEPIWTVDIPRPLGAMPVLTDELAFVSGHAVCRDTGRIEYVIDVDVRCPPAVTDTVALLSRRQSVVAFDPETGDIRWSDDIPAVTRPKQPALTEAGAYVAAGDRLIAYQ